jgi:LuxR family maltose regulon positive regulatory protein
LIERLNASPRSGRKLTLISAPAGFGKTTLLSTWINQSPVFNHLHCAQAQVTQSPKFTWLSLDKEDNDAVRFWTYFVAALQTLSTKLSQLALEALQSPQSPALQSILPLLLNDIATFPYEIVLVLDDYHVISTQAIHDGMAFLLDHQPQQLHLVLSTRADPPLPISRLRARGQLTELRADDLRFTPDEAAMFLNETMGLGLPPQDVETLESRTEGWIVGLQLAAIAMQSALSVQGRADTHTFIQAFSGSQRYVLDYLLAEVLLRQPASVQTFLLETAILNRLTGPLCDAVTKRSDSRATLEQLDAANLFVVPLDDERRWYRYHHLFADLLRSRLAQVQPDPRPVLHRRASAWCEKNGLFSEAVGHALAAGDADRVARMVEGNAFAIMDHGDLAGLVRQLDALPDPVWRAQPWLYIAQAWARSYTGPLEAIEPLLQDADEAWAAFDGTRRAEARHIAGHIAAIRSFTQATKGVEHATTLARQALERLPETSLTARCVTASRLGSLLRTSGHLAAAAEAFDQAIAISQAISSPHITVNVLCDLLVLQLVQGSLSKAVATFQRALRLANDHVGRGRRQLPAIGTAYRHTSLALREWNDLDAALRHAQKSIEIARQWGQSDNLAAGYLNLSDVLQALGDPDRARDAIRQARQVGRGLAGYVDAWEARLHLAQGNVAAASHWAHKSGLDAGDAVNFQRKAEYITLARVYLATDKFDEARRLLARLLQVVQAAGSTLFVIKVLVLQALALKAKAESPDESRESTARQAMVVLERALNLAEPENYVRTFVDEGAPMSDLLRQAAARGTALDYVSRLLVALEKETKYPHPSQRALVAPLSERELKVLQLLSVGLSNKEIAQTLFIAVGTVKNHLKNIYRKLDVHSRTQAVNRARDLGLL